MTFLLKDFIKLGYANLSVQIIEIILTIINKLPLLFLVSPLLGVENILLSYFINELLKLKNIYYILYLHVNEINMRQSKYLNNFFIKIV